MANDTDYFTPENLTKLLNEETTEEYFDEKTLSLPSSIPSQNENIKPKKEIVSVGNLYKELSLNFDEVYKTNIFPDDYLIINDVELNDIPATAINLSTADGVCIIETLRTSNPIVIPRNGHNISLQISLVFNNTKEHLNKLHRMLSVIQVHPLTYIYNNKIRKSLGVPYNENTIFILEYGNLRSSPNVAGGYLLDLQFNYFNYKPFSNHYWYNISMPGGKSTRGRFNDEVAKSFNNNNLGDLTGYAASDYKISQATEQLYSDMKKESYRFGLGKDPLLNQPVPFPAASEAWMYLADHLSKDYNVTETPTDYIGFEVTEYQQFSPPSEAMIGRGNPSKLLNKQGFPETNDFYKAIKLQREEIISKTATERKVEAISENKELLKNIKIAGTNSEGKWTERYINIDDPASLKILKDTVTRRKDINRLNKKNKTIEDFKFNPNILLIFSSVSKLFPGKKINIIRGAGGDNGPHGTGIALDLKVSGVENKELFRALYNEGWGSRFGGLEYLPNSTFVHVDVRGIANTKKPWIGVDLSSPGAQSQYVSDTKTWLQVNGIISGRYSSTQEVSEMKQKYFNDEIELNKGFSDSQRYEEEKLNDSKRSIQSRVNWIVSMKEKGWNYYWGDKNVRNVFYKIHNCSISGNSEDIESLNNIVCSSISLNFGHRIVPHRLLTQDTCTYQFLGAGNKSGTMVFTFAGEEGKKSSDYLKSLFKLSRQNNMEFKSLIAKSGAITLNTEDPNTGRKNNILNLLNFKNIIISDVNESSVPGGMDQYQLVVNFILQNFTEEEFEKRFITTTDIKQRIISVIMDFIYPAKLKYNSITEVDGVRYEWDFEKIGGILDNVYIKPKKKVDNTPAWLKDIIIKAAKICNRLNAEMPPSLWKTSSVADETWKDKYSQFGAQDVMLGQVKNIEIRERNAKPDAQNTLTNSPYNPNGNYLATFNRDLSTIDSAIQENKKMYNGKFVYNGGKYTNKIHQDIFNKWTDQISIIVDEVKKYMMSDKKNFDNYFGSISDELIMGIVNDLGSCYKDMNMPVIPGGTLSLPPEFYIYNDSEENPAIMNLTDDRNMELFLEKHIKNERASIKHFIHDNYLGGSYLSKNLPKILRERASYMQQFEDIEAEATGSIGESDFFNPENMMTEGTKVWDPLFYIFDDDKYPSTSSKNNNHDIFAWKDRFSQEYLDGINITGEEGVRTKFMDNIIALSPYLKNNRGNINIQEDDIQATIESIYDEDWRKLTFGPNIENIKVDEAINGYITSNTEKNKQDNASKTKRELEAKNANNNIDKEVIKNTKQLPDGTVVNVDNAEVDSIGTASAQLDQELRNGDWQKQHDYINKYLKEKYDKSTNTASQLQIREALASYQNKKYQPKINGNVKKITGDYLKTAANITNWLLPGTIARNALIDFVEDKYNDYDNSQKQKFTEKVAAGLPNHNSMNERFANENNDKNLAKMCKGIAFGRKAEDLSMRRVNPTFKIYFIEEDSEETEKVDGQVLRAWDDFYSYSSVQELKIIRSRKNAADLAILRITNVGNKLLKKRHGDKDPVAVSGDTGIKYGVAAEYSTGILADTEKENPFEKLVLKDGIKTQIRLGYDDSVENLETVFLGSIVEISPSDDGNIIEIMIQGYGAELESVELGPYEDGPVFYSTQQVLSAAIIQDSIVNFGRRGKYNKNAFGEGRHSFTGGLGKGLASQGVTDLITKWSDEKLYRFFYHYQFLNYPQDDNIYAPPPNVYTTTWMRFWNNACIYRPLNQTPWEIFKEHELRHPGYISMAVPYGNSPRMTMFFGAKGQHYWSKPPTNKEIFFSETVADSVVAGRGLSASELKQNPEIINQIKKIAGNSPELAKAILTDLSHDAVPITSARAIGEIFGRYKPFRGYHYFDSNHHILKNNIRTSKDGVFNEVEILYFENENEIEEDDSEELALNIEMLSRKDAEVFASKLDDNLPEQYIRSYTKAFPSCITKDMAKRYAQGLFARHLRDAYKGELIVLGDATIKPYNIVYLNDMSINMTGPIEVESVVHIFNREQGFVSIITPDLCVDINDFYSATVFDVAGAAFANLYSLDNPQASSLLAGTIAGPISYLGLCGAVKFMQWTQGNGDPVIITPLTLDGKPFVSVSVGVGNASAFTTWGGQWNQMWDDIGNGWRKFDFTEELLDTGRTWQEKLYTVLSSGKGAGYKLEKA